jgi:hypothetical protein
MIAKKETYTNICGASDRERESRLRKKSGEKQHPEGALHATTKKCSG